MTELDTELLPAVFDLIDELGKVVAFTTSTLTDDPATGTVEETDVVEHDVKVVPPYEFSQRLADGDMVQVGDLHVMAPALDLPFTPTLAQKVEIDSTTYTVVRVNPIYSGESICAYDFQVRR